MYDIITYHATMMANPVIPNLSANIGISETINHELMKIPTIMKMHIRGEESILLPSPIRSEPQKRALAGVGNPINPRDCRSSRLNFANRSAENAAIIYAIKGRMPRNDSRMEG